MSGRGQADLDKAAPIKWRYMIGDKAVTGSLRTAICVLAMLSVIACAVNLAPAGDVLLAGTEDERDNVLGRLLCERGPILLFSQRSRRELETESARAADRRADGQRANGRRHGRLERIPKSLVLDRRRSPQDGRADSRTAHRSPGASGS